MCPAKKMSTADPGEVREGGARSDDVVKRDGGAPSFVAIEARRKRILAVMLIIIAIAFLLALGTTAIAQSNSLLGVVDYLFALLLGADLVFLYQGGSYRGGVSVGLVGFGVFILFLLCTGGVAWTAYLWVYVYPVSAIYLLGSRLGTAYSVGLFVVFLVLRFLPLQLISPGHPYTFSFLIRFTAVYAVILLMSLYYESSRNAATAAIEQVNLKLQQLSAKDGLTGVGNRRFFDEQLRSAWQLARRTTSSLSLLMIDFDNFKLYNDEYGHLAGDEVLVRTAEMLAHRVTRSSDMVARYGGEEFCLLLPGTDAAGAQTVADKVLRSVRELRMPHIKGVNGFVSVSVGIAALTPSTNGSDASRLVSLADQAMYEAKRLGKDRSSVAMPSEGKL